MAQQLRTAKSISRIASRLARSSDLGSALDASLADLGTLVAADRAYVFEFREANAYLDNTYEWCAPGVSAEIDNLQGLASEEFPWLIERLRLGEAVQIADVGALPPEALAEHRVLEAQQIRSLLAMPFGTDEGPTGFVGLDNVREAGTWRAEEVDLLRVIAQLIGDALQRESTRRRLELSEQRQRAILQNIPDIAWLKDAASRFIHVNDRLAEASGMPPEALIGKTDLDVWPEELAIRYREDDLEVMRSGRCKRLEEPFVDKALGERIIETIKAPVQDSAGRVVGTTGIARDVTERKRAEAALQQSTQRYRRLVESLPAIVYAYSLRRGASYWSPQVEEILGFSAQELERNPFIWHNAIHADDLPKVDAAIKAFEVGKDIDLVYRIRDADGAWHWFHDRSLGRLDIAGDVVIEGLAFDITGRKRAEEALAREREKALVTLHSIGDAVISTDADGRVEYLNAVAESLTGWSCTNATGRLLSEIFRIVDEDSGESALESIYRCLRDGHTGEGAGKTALIDRAGKRRPIEESVAPIRDREDRLLGLVVVFRDVTERRRLDQQIAHAATHDALTGLVNRAEFERRLDHAIAAFLQHGTPNALCFLDLDRFKLVNDAAGHAAGDKLLKEVSALLANQVRSRDTLARLGGDEFGLLLENCPAGKALEIAEGLVGSLNDFQFCWGSRRFAVGVSIGLVPFTLEGAERSTLTRRADMACFAAKGRGRNRVHLYRPDEAERIRRNREIMSADELRNALQQERFVLFAQPIRKVADLQGPPDRYELLVRLRGEGGELLLPGAFMSAAERYGLIGDLEQWVIRSALSAYATIERHSQHAGIAINLTGHSLIDERLLVLVRTELARSGIDPRRLCFEISETAAVNHLSLTQHFVGELRELGCRFALDDFGSGLSSFHYLKELPADYLKVDGSLVRNLPDEPVDRAMIKAINDIAHTLGIATVAEQVETAAVLGAALASGFDFVQGFALGHPVPLGAIGD